MASSLWQWGIRQNRRRIVRCAMVAIVGLGTLLALPGSPACADETATQARQVVERWKDAVVMVRLVVKIKSSYGGGEAEENEMKYDKIGTVIDAGGLTVMSLAELDPAEAYRRTTAGQADGEKYTVESQVSSAKLRLADGTEVPAKIVLRDADLDLAFVRPVDKPAHPLVAADLAAATTAQLLDQVVTLNRLGNAGDWAIAPRVDRIQAIIAKPRLVYVPQDADALGTPAFALDGKLVGITVLRMAAPTAGAERDDSAVMPAILPAAVIADIAKQAE